jgi:hypothetical protein
MAKIFIKQRFGATPNDLLYNKNISLKAKGLYGYIQAKPDNWNFSAQKITLECKEAIDSIRLALKELEDYGYLVRKKHQNDKGHWEIDYILLSEPELKNPTLEKPTLDFPIQGFPTLENTPNNINNTLQNNINNKKSIVLPENEFSSKPTDSYNPELFPNSVNNEKQIPKKVSQKKVVDPDKAKKTLFRNSDVYKLVKFDENNNGDFTEFEKLFKGADFDPIDLVYYFHTVSDWSDQKDMKRSKQGWIATVRQFIRGDAEKNKIKLKPEFQQNHQKSDSEDMLKFLNNDY